MEDSKTIDIRNSNNGTLLPFQATEEQVPNVESEEKGRDILKQLIPRPYSGSRRRRPGPDYANHVSVPYSPRFAADLGKETRIIKDPLSEMFADLVSGYSYEKQAFVFEQNLHSEESPACMDVNIEENDLVNDTSTKIDDTKPTCNWKDCDADFNQRTKVSNKKLKEAYNCIQQGQLFLNVCHDFNIPVATFILYMKHRMVKLWVKKFKLPVQSDVFSHYIDPQVIASYTAYKESVLSKSTTVQMNKGDSVIHNSCSEGTKMRIGEPEKEINSSNDCKIPESNRLRKQIDELCAFLCLRPCDMVAPTVIYNRSWYRYGKNFKRGKKRHCSSTQISGENAKRQKRLEKASSDQNMCPKGDKLKEDNNSVDNGDENVTDQKSVCKEQHIQPDKKLLLKTKSTHSYCYMHPNVHPYLQGCTNYSALPYSGFQQRMPRISEELSARRPYRAREYFRTKGEISPNKDIKQKDSENTTEQKSADMSLEG